MSDTKPKPCPCGYVAQVVGVTQYHVQCERPGPMCWEGPISDTAAAAIAAWNRVVDAAQRLERVRKLLGKAIASPSWDDHAELTARAHRIASGEDGVMSGADDVTGSGGMGK